MRQDGWVQMKNWRGKSGQQYCSTTLEGMVEEHHYGFQCLPHERLLSREESDLDSTSHSRLHTHRNETKQSTRHFNIPFSKRIPQSPPPKPKLHLHLLSLPQRMHAQPASFVTSSLQLRLPCKPRVLRTHSEAATCFHRPSLHRPHWRGCTRCNEQRRRRLRSPLIGSCTSGLKLRHHNFYRRLQGAETSSFPPLVVDFELGVAQCMRLHTFYFPCSERAIFGLEVPGMV